ncbi:MAG: pyrD [Rickettsiales bacterium]|jgi:dihydroorotate dehydrogenase|nr:pyrD [Rickettsiales bacterium]
MYTLLRSAIFRLSPETAHYTAINLLKYNIIPPSKTLNFPSLNVRLAGLVFPNPLGLAAGFDKNAECIPSLTRQGFGFVEVGTVTPEPQTGNPKPRLFRLNEDEAIINRMGFNNKGSRAFIENLNNSKDQWNDKVIVGANIGKNKTTEDPISDYLTLLERCYGMSDYITVNISSPNTPGLRDLQGKEALNQLLSALMDKRKLLVANTGKTVPLFLKIAPDLSLIQAEDVVESVLSYPIDALIVSNTTIARPDTLQSPYKTETGGLSGHPLFVPSTELLRTIYRLTKGKVPLIGVGGIGSAEEAYTKIKAGASLIQIYSMLIYKGFSVVNKITSGLAERLERDGFASISEAVGVEVQ